MEAQASTFISVYFKGLFYLVLASMAFGLQACKSRQKSVEPVTKKQELQRKNEPSRPMESKSSSADLQHILGLSSKEIKKSALFSFVNDWYGVPYKYGGCQKSGVDCSCFTNLLYEAVYNQKLTGNAAELYKSADKISMAKAREGDLVFFKINVTYVSHVGVLLRGEHFVHASTSKGVIVSSLNEAYYKKYFHSAGRLK